MTGGAPGRCPICGGALASRPGGALVCPRCEPGDSLATCSRRVPGPEVLDAEEPAPAPGDGPPHWRDVSSVADLPPGGLERLADACARWRAGEDLDAINRDLLLPGGGPVAPGVRDPLAAIAEEGGVALAGGSRVAIRGPGVPEAIGRYRIVCRLGEGGMGQVYLGFRPGLERDYAVKTLKTGRGHEPRLFERFRREARALSRMRHPNIVPLVDVELDGPVAHLSMDFIAGRSLVDRIREGVPIREGVGIVAKVCRAADHAHQAGILHRDIKPGNVLLDGRGEPFLTDFGLASLPDASKSLTRTGDVLGTPLYLPPEALELVDDRGVAGDVFSLGVVLYETLSGAHPFAGSTPVVSFRRLLEGRPTPLRERDPDLPAPLVEIVTRAIDPKPERRQPSAARLADELEAWLAGRPLRRPGRPRRRLAVGALAVIVAAGAVGLPRLARDEPIESPAPEGIVFLPLDGEGAPPVDLDPLRRAGAGEGIAILARGADRPGLWRLAPGGSWTEARPEGIREDDWMVPLRGRDAFLFVAPQGNHHAAARARRFEPGSGLVHACHLREATNASLVSLACDPAGDLLLALRLDRGQLLAIRYRERGADWVGELDPEHLLVGSAVPVDAAHDSARSRTWFAYRRPTEGADLTIVAADWTGDGVAWLSFAVDPAHAPRGEVQLAAGRGVLAALAADGRLLAAVPSSGPIEFRPLPLPEGTRPETTWIAGSDDALYVLGAVEGRDRLQAWTLAWDAIR